MREYRGCFGPPFPHSASLDLTEISEITITTAQHFPAVAFTICSEVKCFFDLFDDHFAAQGSLKVAHTPPYSP
jgi:hypothetical protein